MNKKNIKKNIWKKYYQDNKKYIEEQQNEQKKSIKYVTRIIKNIVKR